MLPHSKRFTPPHNGAALVIVLAFIVLLTGLVVAFFSRTLSERGLSNSSANEARTEMLAQGAIATIIGDIKQEIAAGSIATIVTTGSGDVSIYQPTAAVTSVPALALAGTSGLTSFAPNLLKRSAFSQPPYSGSAYNLTGTTNTVINGAASTVQYIALARAAALPTTGTSQNGRSISLARWNKALLLPKATGTSSTDFTPITTGSNAFAAPDWILVARSGSNPITWNPNMRTSGSNTATVVGRYAYTIYDEGGLLDMNVAGCPDVVTSSTVGCYKSTTAFADLTQLKDASGNQLLTQPQINAIVGWRNYASAQASGTFPSYTFPSAATYAAFVTSTNTNGFLSVGNQALNAGQTDRMFSSRQQLINLLTQGIATTPAERATLQNALQYLGTFSREVNAPSFNPTLTNFKTVPYNPADATTARPKLGDSYQTNNIVTSDSPAQRSATSGSDSMFNPCLANVRWPNDATLPDGSAVKKGTPMLRKRFPLSRLGLLSPNGQSNATATKADSDQIYRNFGLWRASASDPWTYDHGKPQEIMTLQELADAINDGIVAARDPDFFELLQASIALGSLARDAGVFTCSGSNSRDYDQKLTAHVLQIGANIIDQFDADNYPTDIQIADVSGAYLHVYGVENLPYISKIIPFLAVDPNHKDVVQPTAQAYGGWFVFELWNPHQNTDFSKVADSPTHFRVGATAGGCTWPVKWTDGSFRGSPAIQSGTSPTFTMDSSAVEFDVNLKSGVADPSSFLNPTLLTSDATININNRQNVTSKNPDNIPANANWVGVFGGDTPMLSGTGSMTHQIVWNYTYAPNPSVDFQIQYWANNTWNTYSEWKSVGVPSGAGYGGPTSTTINFTATTPQPTTFLTSPGNAYHYAKVDPRTARFGVSASLYYYADIQKTMIPTPSVTQPPAYSSTKIWGPSGMEMPYYYPDQSAGFPAGVSTGNVYKFAGLFARNNEHTDSTNVQYYMDPDGVVRRGDGMRGTLATANYKYYGNVMIQAADSNGNFTNRPIILNRPFQSVGELGYAFRDVPWKSLDLWTSRSGDSALLDVFSVSEEPEVVAGRVNINTRNSAVLQTLISGASKNAQGSASYLTAAEAKAFAAKIVQTTGSSPFHNRSDLVNRLNGDDTASDPNASDPFGACFDPSTQTMDSRVKERRESVIRALNGSVSSRTWNLLIDVIAQSGRYGASATKLENFTVEGEKHYWFHVAIDRYTGQVVDQQLESVNE